MAEVVNGFPLSNRNRDWQKPIFIKNLVRTDRNPSLVPPDSASRLILYAAEKNCFATDVKFRIIYNHLYKILKHCQSHFRFRH